MRVGLVGVAALVTALAIAVAVVRLGRSTSEPVPIPSPTASGTPDLCASLVYGLVTKVTGTESLSAWVGQTDRGCAQAEQSSPFASSFAATFTTPHGPALASALSKAARDFFTATFGAGPVPKDPTERQLATDAFAPFVLAYGGLRQAAARAEARAYDPAVELRNQALSAITDAEQRLVSLGAAHCRPSSMGLREASSSGRVNSRPDSERHDRQPGEHLSGDRAPRLAGRW